MLKYMLQTLMPKQLKVELFYEDQQDFPELTLKKKMSFSSKGAGKQKQEVKRYLA